MINDKITFELAKILNNRIFADVYNDKYAAEDVVCTYDNYLGEEHYKAGELIESGDYVHGKFYYAPTYGEVIDWLIDKDIIIKFEPAFTYALKDRVAYYYTVYKLYKDGSLTKIFGDNEYMSSFPLAIKAIVEKLLAEKYID